jgi:MOSC domain-containing protein YiiM
MNEQVKRVMTNPRTLNFGDRVSIKLKRQQGFYARVLKPGVIYNGEVVEKDEYTTKVIFTSESGHDAWFDFWEFRRMIQEQAIEITDCKLIKRFY